MHVDFNPSSSTRSTLSKWLPILLAAGLAWLVVRGIGRLFWTSFGLFWAFWWTTAWFVR